MTNSCRAVSGMSRGVFSYQTLASLRSPMNSRLPSSSPMRQTSSNAFGRGGISPACHSARQASGRYREHTAERRPILQQPVARRWFCCNVESQMFIEQLGNRKKELGILVFFCIVTLINNRHSQFETACEDRTTKTGSFSVVFGLDLWGHWSARLPPGALCQPVIVALPHVHVLSLDRYSVPHVRCHA